VPDETMIAFTPNVCFRLGNYVLARHAPTYLADDLIRFSIGTPNPLLRAETNFGSGRMVNERDKFRSEPESLIAIRKPYVGYKPLHDQ